jgi:hypothetical protein
MGREGPWGPDPRLRTYIVEFIIFHVTIQAEHAQNTHTSKQTQQENERDQWIASFQTNAGSSDEVAGTDLRLVIHERVRR